MAKKQDDKPVSPKKAGYELGRAAQKMNDDEQRASESRARWQTWVLDAYEAGLTYSEIAAVSGKSRVRIDQVIRAERVARGIPINSKESA